MKNHLIFAGFGDDSAGRIHDHTVTGELHSASFAANGGRDQEALVIERPHPAEQPPIGQRTFPPRGRDDEHLRAAIQQSAKHLGEAQVVANRQPCAPPPRVHTHDILTRRNEILLAAGVAEEMHLAIATEQRSVTVEDDGGVEKSVAVAFDYRTAV